MKLSKLEKEIIILLYKEDKPLSNKFLSKFSGLTTREIRRIIKNLSHNFLIGSSSKGYFWIRTNDDIDKAVSILESQAKSRMKRASDIKKLYRTKGQLKLKKILED